MGARVLAARIGRHALRILLVAASLALAWVTLWPDAGGVRDAEGFPTTVWAVALAGAWVAAALAWAIGQPWRAPVVWLLVSSAAHALWLYSVRAGNSVGYEHWGPAVGRVRPLDVAAIAFIAAQAVAVGVALARGDIGRRMLGFVRARLGLSGGLLIAIVWIGTTANPNRDLAAFGVEVGASTAFRVVQLLTLALAVAGLQGDWADAWTARIERLLSGSGRIWGLDRVATFSACAAFAVSALLCVVAYERHPHVPDEVAYLWNAQYFAAGMLRTPAPAVPEAFETYLVWCRAGWCSSPTPPGWPALLAVGAWLGVPWLVNPAAAAAIVALCFTLLRDVYGRPTARLGALLLASSPWFLLVSMSLMTHNASLLCALVAALAGVRLWRGGAWPWASVGGAALGLVSLVRPLEGVAASVVVGLVALLRPTPLLRRTGVCALLAAVAIGVGAIQLAYNHAMSGDARVFPINAYTDLTLAPGANSLGFGPDRGVSWGGLDPFPGHGLPDVLVNTALNATAINQELFAWSIGSLLAIALFIAARRFDVRDAWFLGAAAWVVFLHAFYWFSGGPDFGARYWYLTLPCLIALAARAVLWLDQEAGGGRVAAVALALSLTTLLNYLPWRTVDKYHDYRGMRPDVRALREELGTEPALVLVRGKMRPDLASALPYNPIDLNAPRPIFAWDRDPSVRERLLQAYRDRPVYVLDGPTRTGRGFALVAGPIPPAHPLPPSVAGEHGGSE
jgi:hypothetical protein